MIPEYAHAAPFNVSPHDPPFPILLPNGAIPNSSVGLASCRDLSPTRDPETSSG